MDRHRIPRESHKQKKKSYEVAIVAAYNVVREVDCAVLSQVRIAALQDKRKKEKRKPMSLRSVYSSTRDARELAGRDGGSPPVGLNHGLKAERPKPSSHI